MHHFEDIAPQDAALWLSVPGDWRRPDVDGSYEILWNAGRSYGQVWPRPSLADVISFYDLEDYYTHTASSASAAQAPDLWQRIQTKLSWLLDKGVEPDAGWWASLLGRQKLRILEVGCGNGSNLSIFTSLGHDVAGVEPDAVALEVAQKKGHTVYPGTAEVLPAEVVQDRFDVVVFMHVLEHCINPSLAVKNAAGLLNRGGCFVAEVPNNDCRGVKRFGELWHWLDAPRHLNFFTAASLGAITSASGFRVDQILFRGYCRQFSPGWKEAQAHIADVFGAAGDKRIGHVSYWRYLLETACSEDLKKYDSVRVVGVLS